ncbi:MAG: hypothetical protein JWR16_1349 [Nevskia sp.]|nr:hypothetical protein [Nevskia sp.]
MKLHAIVPAMEMAAITGRKTIERLRRYTQLRAEQIAKRAETLAKTAYKPGRSGRRDRGEVRTLQRAA